ncbi:biopolymer transport protein ExbD [Rubripirellula reticaptiva]|uniref:Biopolymer transport protein ExbD n=2 Tax=Rubripirellula reticaptiva TaxID=2528013 RepID=A0A5C6F9G5_9BACT|nr:biopolymer transport protein ExbD [Rubripirellula reticaptiva]
MSYHGSMRVPQSHGYGSNRRTPVGANMTPMIDVVFLLIIFFLVSSHLARQENHLPLELPVASSFDPMDLEKSPLTISVDGKAQILISGKIVAATQLEPVFADLIRRSGADAAIRIRCEGAVQYQYVEPILRQAALAGITDAAIAVREESAK